ncbi:fibronectin type III domain-containing protein [Flavicella sp.]|uniref:fibronectin type III domain-containing protein n=1 Tax=Flavicella sp. TaxID=2957742 RepID=UPI003015ACB6
MLTSSSIQTQELRLIEIDTLQGHKIQRGASGFNVRIADKVWSYSHPEFVEVVKELKPGWLRYFSGTMGDSFSSATGKYDLDFISMFDHKKKQFLTGYLFLEVKGPHRLIDMYELLGEINGKLVITVNAFSETPEMILELARFCKNNNIKVELWQFCNEPYFYIPNRNRYWWNDGYDYAVKMEPYAEVIREVFPEANLALNYTWDGVWTFMKEIYKFQEENGAYWNAFTKHSYAPHTGRKESLDEAYKRGNTKLIEVTSAVAMKDIEDYSWKDVPMSITEFGVWNKPLNGIYASVYNIEYVMRQLEHTNTQFVGAHEISNKYTPLNKKNKIIETAFKNNVEINSDTLLTGIRRGLEGKAYKIYHEATNSSTYLYKTKIVNNIQVAGMKNKTADGMFAQTYKGINGFNYLVVTNRSKTTNKFQIKINGKKLNQKLYTSYLSANSLKAKDANIREVIFNNGILTIKPFSVSVSKWKTNAVALQKPRIYKTQVKNNGIFLKWGEIPNARSYEIYYGVDYDYLDKTVKVLNNSCLITAVSLNKNYFFKVKAFNEKGKSKLSDSVLVGYQLPNKPKIFKVSRRNNSVTLFWKSVPNANDYLINYIDENGIDVELNTHNVYGYRIDKLKDSHTYKFTVTSKNGLGKSLSSEKESVFISKRVPLSPRNVSAIKNSPTKITVKWHKQDRVLENTCYNVYRGVKLHEFSKVASCLQDTVYIDENIVGNKQYYYIVKAETEVGESNFHANIATAFSLENSNKLNIQLIDKTQEGYLVKVNLNKIQISKGDSYGVIINNVSYLNVENIKIFGDPNYGEGKSFETLIPFSKVKDHSNYAIKAFVIKQGQIIESAIVNQYISKK